MEYVVALLVLGAFGYFVYRKVTAKKKTSGTGGSGGGGRNDGPGNNTQQF